MHYSEIPPPPHLAALVRCAWRLACDAPAEYVALPDGCCELIVRRAGASAWIGERADEDQPACFMAGQLLRPQPLRFRAGSLFEGVRVYPWAAHVLSARAGPALVQCWFPTPELRPPPESTLLDLLDARFARDAGQLDPVLLRAAPLLAGGACASAGALARACAVERRTLERRFAQVVGVSPKQYLRVLRFERATRRITADPATNLADLAADLGFADQAHMAREFRTHAEMPPSLGRARAPSPVLYLIDGAGT